jgi:hypothetical protein
VPSPARDEPRVNVGPYGQAGGGSLARIPSSPSQPLELRADGEVNPLGVTSCGLDRARPCRSDVHRHLGKLRADEPADRAPRSVEFYLLPPQITLEYLQPTLELGHGYRVASDLGEGRVAAAEAERRAACGLRLQGRRGGGGDRQVAGYRISHAGAKSKARGDRPSRRELHPDIRVQILTIGEQ